MILKEEKPKMPILQRYIDRYQLYRLEEIPSFMAIPNGKIELYLVLQGHLERWDSQLGTYVSCGVGGIFPATNQVSYYRIPDYLICLNIKLNLKIVSLSSFTGLLKGWKDISILKLFGEQRLKSMRQLTEDFKPDRMYGDHLDDILDGAFSGSEQKDISSILDQLEKDLESIFKVKEVAKRLNMSTKTLERITQKYFNLSPKNLINVLRFESATSHILQNENSYLMDALAFGYYDQPHFIKDCRKITGYSPKAFFSRLKLPTNDLLFE